MSEPNSAGSTPRFCPQCGSPVKNRVARFCSTCGTKFTDKPPAEPSGSAVPPMAAPPSQSAPAGSSGPARPTGMTSGPALDPFGRPIQQGAPPDQQPPTERWRMTTPENIRPVESAWFNKDELQIIGIFILVAMGSHLFRFMIVFNAFPTWQHLIFPIPLYTITVFAIFGVQKFLTRDKGLQLTLQANQFDYSRSLVFSSFFLTLLPPRLIIDKEASNLPDKITIRENTNQGMVYQEVNQAKYVGGKLRPRMHFFSNLILMLFSIVILLFYINTSDVYWSTSYRFVMLYLTSYLMVEMAPIVGRNNEKSAEYGRIRTLLMFLLVVFLFVVAMFGEIFFTALQDRIPI